MVLEVSLCNSFRAKDTRLCLCRVHTSERHETKNKDSETGINTVYVPKS
jgi:hypothetical protein